jgi:glyoxylase-like metal-dependent hydrolase (beta-lactamase superfamily II)
MADIDTPASGLTRRSVMTGTAALAAAALGGLPVPAQAAPYRFKEGAFEVTVVSDGHMVIRTSFLAPGAPAEARAAVLRAAGQTGETYESPTNVTLVRTPSELILIDAGAGPNFLPTTGKLIENLKAAGIAADSIGKVVFTHAHPDHIWGATDDFDELAFPNARYFVSAAEWNYWTSDDAFKGISEDRQNFITGARRNLARMKDRLVTVKGGDDIVPGLRVVDTPGHSPGHIAVEVAGGEGLMVVGDAITHFLLSFAHPDWPSQGDQDQERAASTRKRLLERLAADKLRLVGFHLPYPGVGHVERKNGAFRFVPA